MTTTPTLATPAPCTCHERPSRTTTKPRRAGFPLLRCPRCGRDGMVIEVDRATLHCCECGSNGDPITAAEIHALIDQWRRFLAWFERSADAPGEDR